MKANLLFRKACRAALALIVFAQISVFAQTDTPEYWNKEGLRYYSKGEYSQAERCFLEAAKLNEALYGKDHPEYAVSLNNLGEVYRSMGDYARAERHYLEAIALQERTLGKDNSNYALLLNNLGLAYFGAGDYARAEMYSLEALDIKERVLGKDHPSYALSLNNLGELYRNMGDYAQAERCYREALSVQEHALGKGHPDYAKSLNNLGSLYYNMGDNEKAKRYYLEASGIWERVLGKDHPDYARSLNNLGLLYKVMGDYAQAERCYREASGVQERVFGKDHSDYAVSVNNLGELYRTTGDYAQAERCYREASGIWERLLGKDHSNYALSLNNLGMLYSDMGNYAQAEWCFLEASDTWERVLGKDHPSYALSLNNLGELYRNMGDYVQAERYYREASSVQERVLGKDHLDYAKSLNNLGALCYDMGDNEKAKRYYLEASGIWERVLGKDHPDYALSLNNLGVLYYGAGDFAQAARYYREALVIKERVLGKDHPDYAKSLNNLGSLYQVMGDYAQAERCYREALGIFERVFGKDHPDYINSVDNLYSVYLDKQEYLRAFAYKQEAYALMAGQVNRNFSFLSERQRSAYWDAYARSFESSYTLAWRHPVQESRALSYDNALFSKGLLLRTANAVRDAIYASGDRALVARFEGLVRLRRQIDALRQAGGAQADTGNNEESIRALEQRADTLEKSLTRDSIEFRDFQADLALNWQNVRDSLQANEAAVEFVSFQLYDKGWTGKTMYAALLLLPGMVSPEWLPLCEEEALSGLFAKGLNRKIDEQTRILYDEYGGEIYKAVWKPLEQALEGIETVYYSPSGLLHKVAFDALPVKGNARLADMYSLRRVSSTREIALRKNAAPRPQGGAAVYGGIFYSVNDADMRAAASGYQAQDGAGAPGAYMPMRAIVKKPVGLSPWAFLAGTVSESERIQELLIQHKTASVLYSGNKGNEESFKGLSGKKTAIIHVATHGFFEEDIEKKYQRLDGVKKAAENPLLRSGLVLAGANNARGGRPVEGVEDGILYADEITKINLLGAELVVLSACETGLGTVNNSEGVFGLQRAFKLAGADTLIMSLWSVSDAATSILMREFYSNWLSGKAKQEAFAEAQAALRRDARYAAPYFWAAFVLID